MKPRKRKCRVCKKWIESPRSTLQIVCSTRCSIEYGKKQRIKKEKANDRKERDRLKTRGQWLKEAQAQFNRYVRQRDSALPCISCGRFHNGQNHAGHYYTTSARPDLRFGERGEDNCHLQCQPCNTHLSGNITEYRKGLIARIGQERVDALEVVGRSDWTIEEIKEIRDKYKKKLKKLG